MQALATDPAESADGAMDVFEVMLTALTTTQVLVEPLPGSRLESTPEVHRSVKI